MVMATTADLWHRRMGVVNSQSLRILRDSGDNRGEYIDKVSPCEMYPAGTGKQGAHSKATIHDSNQPFQLGYMNLLRPTSPSIPGGCKYFSKFTDQHSK